MHAVALTYPDNPSPEQKEAAAHFFSSLQYLLPCESCKLNFTNELKMFSLKNALESKQKLNQWLTDLHNSVNVRLKKTVMSPDQVLDYIFNNKDSSHSASHSADATAATPTTTPTTATTSASPNAWGIIATFFAVGLLAAVIVLVGLYRKQKKVSHT
jgi:hypothetical protein